MSAKVLLLLLVYVCCSFAEEANLFDALEALKLEAKSYRNNVQQAFQKFKLREPVQFDSFDTFALYTFNTNPSLLSQAVQQVSSKKAMSELHDRMKFELSEKQQASFSKQLRYHCLESDKCSHRARKILLQPEHLYSQFNLSPANINEKSENGIWPLLIAVLNQDEVLFKFLMDRGADANLKFEGLNLLHVACLNGFTAIRDHEIFMSLVNELDNEGNSPLHYCIKKESQELYNVLIHDWKAGLWKAIESIEELPKDIEELFDSYTKIFKTAVIEEDVDQLKNVVANVNINQILFFERYSAVHMAIKFQWIEGLKILLNGGASIKIPDGVTKIYPLDLAIKKMNLDIIKELIKYSGSDKEGIIDQLNLNGISLEIAKEYGEDSYSNEAIDEKEKQKEHITSEADRLVNMNGSKESDFFKESDKIISNQVLKNNNDILNGNSIFSYWTGIEYPTLILIRDEPTCHFPVVSGMIRETEKFSLPQVTAISVHMTTDVLNLQTIEALLAVYDLNGNLIDEKPLVFTEFVATTSDIGKFDQHIFTIRLKTLSATAFCINYLSVKAIIFQRPNALPNLGKKIIGYKDMIVTAGSLCEIGSLIPINTNEEQLRIHGVIRSPGGTQTVYAGVLEYDETQKLIFSQHVLQINDPIPITDRFILPVGYSRENVYFALWTSFEVVEKEKPVYVQAKEWVLENGQFYHVVPRVPEMKVVALHISGGTYNYSLLNSIVIRETPAEANGLISGVKGLKQNLDNSLFRPYTKFVKPFFLLNYMNQGGNREAIISGLTIEITKRENQ